MVKIKTFITWFCGLWALGLGARLSLELITTDAWVCIPKNPINIYFDFLPLALLGLAVTVMETRDIIKQRRWSLKK